MNLDLNEPGLTEAEISERAELMIWVLSAPNGFWEKYLSADKETMRLVRKYNPLRYKPKRQIKRKLK